MLEDLEEKLKAIYAPKFNKDNYIILENFSKLFFVFRANYEKEKINIDVFIFFGK